jgi:hypothetical protein
MSYYDNGAFDGNTASVTGAIATLPVVSLGELKFRYLPGALPVPQIAMNAGTKQWEIYFNENWGGGANTNYNFNAQALTTTWFSLDLDGLTLTDGSDYQKVLITPTADSDANFYIAHFWISSPTKATIHVQQFDPAVGVVMNNPANQMAVEFHRINLGDFPATNTFSGKQYSAAAGWVPEIAGCFMTIINNAYTSHGLNWKIDAGGLWQLAGDALGANENWRLDIKFTKLPAASVTRFGTFN